MADARIKWEWDYDATVGDEFRLYRSDEPMSKDALPEPIATGIDIGDREYVDDDGVLEGETYYCRVSVVIGAHELVSDELEFVAEYDPLWSYVVALLHFDEDNGSGKPLDVIGSINWNYTSGGAINSDSAYDGAAGLKLRGMHGIYTSDTVIPTGTPFALEARWRMSSLAGPTNGQGRKEQAIWGETANVGYGEFGLKYNDTIDAIVLHLESGVSGRHASSSVLGLDPDKYYHIAQTYDGTTHRVFLDGVKIIEYDAAFGWLRGGQPFRLGEIYVPSYASYRMGANADFDEFRVTVGVPRYTSGFVPPSGRLPDQGPP